MIVRWIKKTPSVITSTVVKKKQQQAFALRAMYAYATPFYALVVLT